MQNIFITQNNLKDLIKDAVNISIASAYLHRTAIDDIKAVLNQLPNKGGKMFRFLLDKEFHPEPMMRQVLINLLYELPNVEVKIYRGSRLFHPKVYIFESGNRLCTTIGSFNATMGGAGDNIEAGVQLTDRDIQRQIKNFFDQYWNDPNTEMVVSDKSAVFVARLFQPGDCVIVRDTLEKGVVLNVTPEFNREFHEWLYIVLINGGRRQLCESQLELIRIATYGNERNFQQRSTNIHEWFKNYFIEKEGEQADNTVATFASTRTALYSYQFRPLFKILHSDQPRLLIADEVGLGKTIEAGIILKELSARGNINRVLIIVPNSLKKKWLDELQIRFDEYYNVLSGEDIVSLIKDYAKGGHNSSIHGVITYDQLVVRSVQTALENVREALPSFDLIIMDEAHWVKNESTRRYKAIKKITKNANAIVMMTATPIQLATKDLFNLLSILVPELCENLDSSGFSAGLTVNHRINRAIKLLKNRQIEEFHEAIQELTTKRVLRRAVERFDNYTEIIERCQKSDREMADTELYRLAADLYTLNILSQYINRTLRKDVADKFPDRNVITWEYSYSKPEAELYDAIIKACRRKYGAINRSAFAVITPERRAASCLMVMYESSLTWEELSEEYREAFDDENELEISEQDTASERTLKASWNDAFSALHKCHRPETDSKLEELKKIIHNLFDICEHTKDKKIMIFCIFKATIRYLKTKLSEAFPEANIETLDGDDDIEARDEKKVIFSRIDQPAIFICSEVAGEGLDFQFCHNLVNYDMPWNPSKLEQRAGRIDRMGQEASVVNIINLVNKLTIEDHIMAKLFERVQLFSNTLGPLGDVLSYYQRDFAKNILTGERSPKDQEAYEQRILANIESKILAQKEFEEQQVELFGAADYFYDESQKQRGHFLENEIRLIWEMYLGDSINNVSCNGDIYLIPLDVDVKGRLLGALKHRGHLAFNERRDRHYETLIAKLSQDQEPLKYTFNQECALQNLRVQFFNIGHPFIQGAIHFIRDMYSPNRNMLTCRLQTNMLPEGHYLLSLYRFSILERTRGVLRNVEDHIFTIDINGSAGNWDLREDILNLIIYDAVPWDISEAAVFLEHAQNILDKNAHEKAEELLFSYKKIEQTARNSRKLSLIRQYNAKKEKIATDMTYIHDPNLRATREAEKEALEKELNVRINEVELGDLRMSAKCTGIICVEIRR